jgi:hypothetical protein
LPSKDELVKLDLSYNWGACLMFLDTEIERKMGVGAKYKFDPMKEGQCLVNSETAGQLNVTRGQIIAVKMEMFQNLVALIDEYNTEYAHFNN